MLISHGKLVKPNEATAITLGNFDGVHLGHQAMLKKLVTQAQRLNIPSVVITFEPHPKEFFMKEKAPARISSLREKVELIYDYGVNQVHIIPFNQELASMSAEDFVEDYLVNQFNARWILIGDDFKFGAKRQGDYMLLKELSREYRFQVESMDSFTQSDLRVSSTHIRDYLAKGNIEQANELLGRSYSISGRVIHGNKLGRTIGFPTANVQIQHNKPPCMGIFVVTLEVHNQVYQGVASLGFRPTVTQDVSPSLEVFIFDFNQNIYGEHVRVNFLHKLRDEEKYDSLEILIEHINKDVDNAKSFFNLTR